MGNSSDEKKKKSNPLTDTLGEAKRPIFKGMRFCLLGISDSSKLKEEITSREGAVMPCSDFDMCTHLCISGHPLGMKFGGSKIVTDAWVKDCCKANRELIHKPILEECLDEICQKNHQLFRCPLDKSDELINISGAAGKSKELTSVYITPGSSYAGHKTIVTNTRIKHLVKMAYVLFRRLKAAKLTLRGNFSDGNLDVEEALGLFTVRFAHLHNGQVHVLADGDDENVDIQQLEVVIRNSVFGDSIPGHDLNLWLSLLDDKEVEDMMVDSVLLMDLESCSDKYSSLYDTFMRSNSTVTDFVLGELAKYNGWQEVINAKDGNTILQSTFEHITERGLSGTAHYPNTVRGLLWLLRNSRQHEALEYGDQYALVIAHHFPNLTHDLQRALYLARKKCQKPQN